MIIYGVALLSFCYFTGNLIGDILGALVGLDSNVGGTGFAMLLLILISDHMLGKGTLSAKAQAGVEFWNGMFLPVIVAMCAIQNVKGAISAGATAFVGGIVTTLLCMCFIPVISRIGGKPEPLPPVDQK